jgi:alkanesulfonate monooxygenase SsuD/methylene tetrahydromethanopterin reductase-like flavin-dependent oxidoreductase (luciferase family)
VGETAVSAERLGFGLAAGAPEETITAGAFAAERAGLGSFWLTYPSPPLSGDGLLRLSAAAAATSRIALAIGVIPLHEHDAAAILRDLTSYRIPVERLRLGIGSGPIAGSLERVRTATRELRRAVECELTIAALGPRMCALAGEVADSVLLNWLDPDHAHSSAEMVRAAARRAGRPMPRIYAYVRVAYGPGSDARLEREARLYSSLPFYAAHFERMGLKATEVAIHAATPADLRARLDPWRGIVDEVIIRALPGQDTIADTLAILDASIEAFEIVRE